MVGGESEQEVLFPAGTRFKVNRNTRLKNGDYLITLEEVSIPRSHATSRPQGPTKSE